MSAGCSHAPQINLVRLFTEGVVGARARVYSGRYRGCLAVARGILRGWSWGTVVSGVVCWKKQWLYILYCFGLLDYKSNDIPKFLKWIIKWVSSLKCRRKWENLSEITENSREEIVVTMDLSGNVRRSSKKEGVNDKHSIDIEIYTNT